MTEQNIDYQPVLGIDSGIARPFQVLERMW